MYLIDPELQSHLSELAPTDFSDVTAARAQMTESSITRPRPFPDPRPTVVEMAVPGLGSDPALDVRTYTPVDHHGPSAGLLYIHGGGFAVGDLDTGEAICSIYASALDAVVVSVGYRLAPEDPFPAGLHDCYAALVWMAAHAAELGIDPTRIGVTGESAGGGLAAALALMSRDQEGPPLRFQLLEIPVLDDRLETASMQSFTDTPVWDRHNAQLSWELYLGPDLPPGDPRVSPYAAPARALDLTGLPPAHVVTAEYDPLRDEGIDYARRLLAAGVSTSLSSYAGTFHGSSMFTEATVSQRMLRDTVETLRRGLAPTDDVPANVTAAEGGR